MDSYRLIQGISSILMEAETRRLNATIIRLNQENKKLRESSVDGFLYQGVHYMPQNVSVTIYGTPHAKNPLHLSLHNQMEAHLSDAKMVKDEGNFIQQTLFRLLNPCKTQQDIRDTLPECLMVCLGSLSHLTRTREPAFTIRDDARALRQYEKILPKMEFYSAAKLFY